MICLAQKGERDMRMTVRHDCGHKERVEVGDGTAQSKSARVFQAMLELCPDCADKELSGRHDETSYRTAARVRAE
jgi:hypothetical protein